MTALSSAKGVKTRGPFKDYEYKLAGSTTIYAGAMIMLKSDGYATPAVAAAGNLGVVGWALENVDNSSGSDGDKNVVVRRGRINIVTASGAQSDVGKSAYASDDQTGSDTQGANEPLIGKITKNISATEMEVEIS